MISSIMQLYLSQIIPVSNRKHFNLKASEIFLTGCNFRCIYCNVSDMLSFDEKYSINLRVAKKEIEANAKLVEAVLFTGGEPTLQKDALVELLRLCRKLKLKAGIHTNGSRPAVLKKLLDMKLLDFLYLDIKSPFSDKIFEKVSRSKTFFIKEVEIIARIKESITILNETDIDLTIVTVIVPSLLYKVEDLYEIAKVVQELGCNWELRGFSSDGFIKDKKFSILSLPTREFLENLKSLIKKRYPDIKISLE